MNIAVIVALILVVLGALMGIKNGFVKTVFALGSTIVAIILTIWLSPMVANMMRNNETIMTTITEKVEENLSDNNSDEAYKALQAEEQDIKHYTSVYIAGLIVKALAFIVTFVIVSLLLWLICHLLNVVAKLPVINFFNRVLGCAAGILEGLVVIWLMFVLVAAMAQTTFGMSVLKMIGESKILMFLYGHNLITYFLGML
ncbi:MAG: CvpA family protein [Lachnospiraceae bacterium]|nr:CvpA family protein [Lachnospiraceae bacterium]